MPSALMWESLAEAWSGIMLHPYEEAGVWQGQLGELNPQNLPPSFNFWAQCSPQEHAATHKAMGQFWHLGTKTTCETGEQKEMVGAALTCVRQQWAFSGGHLSHGPGREARKGLVPPPNTSMECLHSPATGRAPHARGQKMTAFGELWDLAVLKQQVICICRSGKGGCRVGSFWESLRDSF